MLQEPTPLQALMLRRRSIRKFLPGTVERQKIEACLEAARLAPSAENDQNWRFLVIDEPELKDRFCRNVFSGIYGPTRFAAEAPVIVLILSTIDKIALRAGQRVQGIPYDALDIGIAGEHFVLQAEELGLGTCWIGWFNARAARRFFRISRRFKIVSLIALGYPAGRPPRSRVRRAMDEIAWWNRFGG